MLFFVLFLKKWDKNTKNTKNIKNIKKKKERKMKSNIKQILFDVVDFNFNFFNYYFQ